VYHPDFKLNDRLEHAKILLVRADTAEFTAETELSATNRAAGAYHANTGTWPDMNLASAEYLGYKDRLGFWHPADSDTRRELDLKVCVNCQTAMKRHISQCPACGSNPDDGSQISLPSRTEDLPPASNGPVEEFDPFGDHDAG